MNTFQGIHMNGKQIGYIRVSTIEQNTERQLNEIPLDETFTDKCSGKDTNRPALKELIKFVRKDDTVHVHDISRMARNTENLLTLVKELTDKGVKLIFHKESLTFTGEDNPMQQLMLTMLGGIYQFERSMMLERQREGIAIAKLKGKYKGKPVNIELNENICALAKLGTNKSQIAKQLSCFRTTVYKALSN
jgi:DNA invertase Pin-like site-specific DNA recombinase